MSNLKLQECHIKSIHEICDSYKNAPGDLIKIQVLQCKAPLFQLGAQCLLFLQQSVLPGILRWRNIQIFQCVVGLNIVPQPLQHQIDQSIQPDGMAGAQLLHTAVGV